jgi:hypothetical protein
MNTICLYIKNCYTAITRRLAALSWRRIHLVTSHLMCHSSAVTVCADPYDIPTSFTTSLMVMCWSAHTSSFTFQIVSAFTEVESISLWISSSSNPCPHLKWLYQTYTTVFKSNIPINCFQGLQHFCRILPDLAHELDVGSFLKLIQCASQLGVYLHSNSSGTQKKGCNMQPLPTHMHKD